MEINSQSIEQIVKQVMEVIMKEQNVLNVQLGFILQKMEKVVLRVKIIHIQTKKEVPIVKHVHLEVESMSCILNVLLV